ncbi:MAG: DNA topoisomerase IB [Pyrinomonadaceae bacterium]|nr:DNA topoisomerase IB [Pyrinomonadaceae bacterium]
MRSNLTSEGKINKVASAELLVETVKVEKGAIDSILRGARAKWWLRRGAKKRGFRYETAAGRRVTDEAQLERIKSLVIPPAWREVRVSPSARSSLQAIGLDTGGRVQRVYHTSFSARQQRRKYEKIERFGEHLASLRKKTNEDINQEGLTRERVLAVVVRLINDLYFRVGSEESVARYRTYGVTTLRSKHLEIKRDGSLIFSFIGKHHIHHRRVVVDEELAMLMRDIQAIGGAKVFEYINEDGKVRAVTPRDVNDYIKAAMSPEFSAKDFRTWGGTLLAAIKLAELGPAGDEKEAKQNLVRAVKKVSERLGNTPSVCRSCYVHPAVLECYLQGVTLTEFRPRKERRIRRQQPEYEAEELALMKMFRAQKS